MRTSIGCAAFLCALCGSPVAASASAASDDDRFEAQCADAYNTGDPELAREVDRLDKNPALFRLLAEGQWANPDDWSLGPRLDLDLVPLVVPMGDAITGLATGFSFQAQADSQSWKTFGGELRLGLARRVYGIAWSTVSSRCKPRRIDLRVDLLQWQVGAVQDRSGGLRRSVFASTLGFPTLSWGYSYVNWGWKAEWTPLAFQLAPEVEWEMTAHAEYSVESYVFSLRVLGRFLPDPGIIVTVGFGLGNR